mgnify:FL=1|jgi:hypothetical protein
MPKEKCPCCGIRSLGNLGQYEVCSFCKWQDDTSQSANPDLAGGANSESLRSSREKWERLLSYVK